MVALFSSLSQYFFSVDTFVTIANEIPALTVMAVGMTFVLIIAGIDLSVGSVLALSGALSATAILQWQLAGACRPALLGLAAGLLCGRSPARCRWPGGCRRFIVSLGMLEAVRGGAYLVTDSRTQYVGDAICWLSSAAGSAASRRPSCSRWLLVVIGAAGAHAARVFGRYVVGIGTNDEAMRLAGIDPRPIRIIVFAITRRCWPRWPG